MIEQFHEDNDEAHDAGDEGKVEVTGSAAWQLFLEVCQAAKDAGFGV